MDYKKIIKNKNIRFFILKLLSFIPDKTMLKIQYRIKMEEKLNLKTPKTFTEKIQWYKLNYRNPLMTQCADKYEVRKYIESKGLGDILNGLYGVYENGDEIDFERLPDKFVIKTTNGGGGENIIICEDKERLDIAKTRKLLNKWMKDKNKSQGREWAYDEAIPKIIIENFLEDKNNKFNGIDDYKFICFNGQVEYIVLDVDRQIEHKRNIYDKNWNYLKVDTDCKTLGDIKEKPKNLDEMKKIAEKLAEDFPFVRVDLYDIDNEIIFGELTFYPWSGYVKFNPKNFDYEMGEKFILFVKNT
ncbi:ATP-grasp fold amidoligase family protein [Fusobacterium sp. MFO224]|uniref:ATP-grasp fold amidoligase family protein n=1 Tax=Fusobacterium sp. MFO224 TaxID=3378070 RepID=UPI003851EB3C